MPFKTTAFAFMASLAAHTVLIASFGLPVWENQGAESRFVDLSYVRYTPEPAPPKPLQIKYPPMIKPANKSKEISAQVSDTAVPVSASIAKVGAFTVQSSEVFLTDPQKGKIFLDYFGLVKQRIRRAVEKKSLAERPGHGDVSLVFVLKADGTAVKVIAVDKDSSADELMKNFAVHCVKDCSPFPRFPKALGMDRISFNLSILFNES